MAAPKCTDEMRIISFIYKKAVIKKILSHLDVYEEKKNPRVPNQRAPPTMDTPEYTEPIEIVPYDDGWLEYDEPVFDF